MNLGPILQEAYGKVVAILLRHGLPLPVVEDAVSVAMARALEAWPSNGVPHSPAGWLLTVSRHQALDAVRRDRRLVPLTDDVTTLEERIPEFEAIPDERLRLFYLCSHPAIDPGAQTPLMLQLIMGMTAEEIAALYVTPASQLSQRLVRAKRKIRDAGILPVLPDTEEVAERTEVVLDAVYAAYAHAWELPTQSDRRDLAEECIRLASTLAELVPSSAEAKGLLALLLLCESRRGARRNVDGCFVPLDEQDLSRWNEAMIARGEAVLLEASSLRQLGRYQLEAAIQSAHHQRLRFGQPGWDVILQLYEGLLAVASTSGARLGRIAAIDRAQGSEAALSELDKLSGLDNYQPFWALRSHLLRRVGRLDEAEAAARRAAALAVDPSVAAFLVP